MSEKTKHGHSKCLRKRIGNSTVYLYKGWDLANGHGWFAHCYNDYSVGFGFHHTNKLTAVKQSLNKLIVSVI